MSSLTRKLPPIEQVKNREEYAQMLQGCLNSAAAFAVDFLGLEIFDYNKVFLNCNARFIVYRTGRQVGKSRNAAIKAIHFGYFAPYLAHNIEEGECNVVVASISKDQAFLIFRKIANFVHKSKTLSDNIVYETKTELTMRWCNGEGVTNFIVRPIGDTGDALRGFTVHFAILDEAAFIPQRVYDAFIPSTVTTKPKILLTSTPKGKAGAFFNACQSSYIIYKKGIPTKLHDEDYKYKWVQFHVKTKDNPLAASDLAVMDIIKSTSKAAQPQELDGEFMEGGNAIIPYNLLQEALVPVKRPRFAYYDAGIDTSGKGQDETVITIWGITEQGHIFIVDIYTEQSTDQYALAEKIAKYHKIYKFRRIYIDGTAIGDTLNDACRRVDESMPIIPINFKAEKTELYVNLERVFEERIINLSLLPEPYLTELTEQLQYMYWEHGKFKDQKEKVRSDHADDYSDSSALGVYGQQSGSFIQELPQELLTEW